MPEPLLTKERIHDALRRLVEVLKEAGVPTRIYVVGGAALTLRYGARETTRDVDASISNPDGVRPYITSVSRELKLPNDWLNDNALGFISQVHDDPRPVVLIDEEDVVVTIASSEALLAMKIRSSRGRLDIGYRVPSSGRGSHDGEECRGAVRDVLPLGSAKAASDSDAKGDSW